jgi:hypothetical protein
MYMLQVAEKGFAWLKLKLKGRPGHGSTPHGEWPLPVHRVFETNRCLQCLHTADAITQAFVTPFQHQ